MKIKGIQDSYKIHAPAISASSIKHEDSSSAKMKEDNNTIDKVSISKRGSFQTKLNAEIKKYSATAQAQPEVSSDRISELKLKYQGNSCPVSGTDIARAMMTRVCGVTNFEN